MSSPDLPKARRWGSSGIKSVEDTKRWAKAHRGMTGVFMVFDFPILGNITLRDKMIVKKWLSALILFGGIEKK